MVTAILENGWQVRIRSLCGAAALAQLLPWVSNCGTRVNMTLCERSVAAFDAKAALFHRSAPMALIAAFKDTVLRHSRETAHRAVFEHHDESKQPGGHLTVADYTSFGFIPAILISVCASVGTADARPVLEHC